MRPAAQGAFPNAGASEKVVVVARHGPKVAALHHMRTVAEKRLTLCPSLQLLPSSTLHGLHGEKNDDSYYYEEGPTNKHEKGVHRCIITATYSVVLGPLAHRVGGHL